MFETAQPQAETANQPKDISAAESESGGQLTAESEEERADVKTPGEPFMTVRYNKQDKPLSKEEAVVYAQKGMNYDKLHERLKETAAKLSEYGAGLSHATEQAQGKQAVIDGQLGGFMRSYPGIDPRQLPESVISKWKSGTPLTEAYLMHRSQELSAKVREMEKAQMQAEANRANEAASMGGAAGRAPARGKAITEESIKNMTAGELEKNHDRIWAYLTGRGAQRP